jgi:macrolide-specific efflux system membrane fusion protein
MVKSQQVRAGRKKHSRRKRECFFSAFFQDLNLNFPSMKFLQTLDKKLANTKNWFLTRSLALKIIIVAVLLAIGWLAVRRITGGQNQQAQIQTANVEKGTIVSTVSASGNVIASNITNITTQASGVVKKVYVKEGDKVTTGQKIADIELDLDGQQSQAQAYASYLSAKNGLESSQTSLYSLDSAMWAANQKFENDAVARGLDTTDPTYIQENDDWLAAEAKYNNQKNVIAQSQASLNNAWLSYKQTRSEVTAPTAGTISSLAIAEGMALTTQTSSSGSRTGQGVGSIVNEGKTLVSVNISEIDVPNVKTAQKVTVTFDSISGKTFSGEVASINRVGSTTNNVTNYPAIISLDSSSDQILPNMAASANIITQVKDNVLLIPSTAIRTEGGQSVVTLIRNNQQETISVETGISSETQTEITSGLSEGDEVVTSTITNTSSSQGSAFSTNGGFGGAGRAIFTR